MFLLDIPQFIFRLNDIIFLGSFLFFVKILNKDAETSGREGGRKRKIAKGRRIGGGGRRGR